MTTCEQGNRYLSEAHGKAWEHYRLGDRYIFSNQIPNSESWTRTHAGWILNDEGYCQWHGTPPPRIIEETPISNELNPVQMDVQNSSELGGAAPLLVIGLIASAGLAYLQTRRDKADFTDDYHPMSDVPALPPVSLDDTGDEFDPTETDRIRQFQPSEFDLNSFEFDPNSETSLESNSPRIPMDSTDSTTFPPKKPIPCFDPLDDERPTEFDCYRRFIEKHHENPKGNVVVLHVWGCKPGESRRYKAAIERRDLFAKRLHYYRMEGDI